MSEGSGAPSSSTPGLKQAAWRIGREVLAAALAVVGVLALSWTFVPIGHAVLLAGRNGSRAEILTDCVEVLILLLASSFAWMAALKQRPGRLGWLLVAAAALAMLASAWIDYTRSLSLPRHDFHGALTTAPGGVFEDNAPDRPKVSYRTNRHGFRGADWDEAKRPGVVRIALLGDSFVYGLGVEEGETLKARLDEAFAARGAGDRVEVLNLGLCGNNLPTHITMYEISRDHLAADVVVMGLFIHNDLAEWDTQREFHDATRPSLFSALQWLLGREPAVSLFTALLVQHGDARRSRAALDRQMPRLEAAVARPGAPPLIVLPFWNSDVEVPKRFVGKPNLVFIDQALDPEHYLPGDGHPSVRGNRIFAASVMAELERLPSVAAVLAPTGR